MALNDDERDLFENLYRDRSLALRAKYEGELKRLDLINQSDKHPLYRKIINLFGQEELSAYVDAYIEVNKKVGECPNEADYEGFVEDLLRMVPRFSSYFKSRYHGPFSGLDERDVSRIAQLIEDDVKQSAEPALSRLRLFMAEHKVDENKTGDARRRERRSFLGRLALSIVIAIAGWGVLVAPFLRNWQWLQNHPNRIGLCLAYIIIIGGLCLGILNKRWGLKALSLLVLPGILVLVQIIGK